MELSILIVLHVQVDVLCVQLLDVLNVLLLKFCIMEDVLPHVQLDLLNRL